MARAVCMFVCLFETCTVFVHFVSNIFVTKNKKINPYCANVENMVGFQQCQQMVDGI